MRFKRAFRVISPELAKRVEAEVRMLLHAARDAQRNRDPVEQTCLQWIPAWDGYYGEAFGVMRGLEVAGYGYFGSDNLNALHPLELRRHGRRVVNTLAFAIHNLKWWFSEIAGAVRQEENFRGSNECDYCLHHYGKDSAGRTLSAEERARERSEE